jgi:hypothetical protein
MESLWYEQREALLDEVEALRRAREISGEGDVARAGRWKSRAEALGREVEEYARQADAHRQVVTALQLQLNRATEESAAMEQALDALHRQRERERAAGEIAKPVMKPVGVVMTPAGLLTVPKGASAREPENAVGSLEPVGSPNMQSSPVTAVQGFGAGWLAEAQTRQMQLEKLERQAAHFRTQALHIRIEARLQRLLFVTWRAWWGLVHGSKRRRGERLARMASSIVASAVSELPSKELVDHSEWWVRSPKKKGKRKAHTRSSPQKIDTQAIV